MKLNLASGTNIMEGWVNLDIVPHWPGMARGCDIVWDARRDRIPFDNGTVDQVYAGYLLMHIAPRYHVPVLAEIRRVLSDDGELIVGEVDMDIVLRLFLANPSDARLAELIWGEQGNVHGDELADYDKHCSGFTAVSLNALLRANGFTGCERVRIHAEEVYYELTIRAVKA